MKGTATHETEMKAVSDAMQPIDERLDELTDRALELSATTRKAVAEGAPDPLRDAHLPHDGRADGSGRARSARAADVVAAA